jgi:hypothetical protein
MSEPLPSATKKFPPGSAVFMAGVLALIGLYLFESPADSVGDCSGRGGLTLFLLIGLAFYWIPACALLGLIVWGLDKWGWWPHWFQARFILIAGLILPLLGLVFGLPKSSPKAFYASRVGVLEDRVSDIQVSGFRGMAVSRWLFAFTVMPEDAATIASKLRLQEDQSTDLKQFLTNDSVLLHGSVSATLRAAAPSDLKTYSLIQSEGNYLRWTILTVDSPHHRAWLYRGFED